SVLFDRSRLFGGRRLFLDRSGVFSRGDLLNRDFLGGRLLLDDSFLFSRGSFLGSGNLFFRSGGQRHGVARLLTQPGDKRDAFLVVGQAGKAHSGAGREGGGRGQEGVEMGEIPHF